MSTDSDIIALNDFHHNTFKHERPIMNKELLAYLRLPQSEKKDYLKAHKAYLEYVAKHGNPNQYEKYSPSNNYSGRIQSV